VFIETRINFLNKKLKMEGYVTETAQFLWLTKYCRDSGCPERTVLSRMEETRHAYVSLTGNIHEEQDQCGDVMTVGLGLRDCEDESCKMASFGVCGVEFSGLSESYFPQPSNCLPCIRTQWPVTPGTKNYEIYIPVGGRAK
jgi:hypothetical protein